MKQIRGIYFVTSTKNTENNTWNKIPKKPYEKIIYQKIIEVTAINKYLIISSDY